MKLFKNLFMRRERELFNAVINHDTEKVRGLLEVGTKPNYTDEFGKSALMEASENGDIEIVNLLLKNGANVNHQGQMGHTALILSAAKGHAAVVSSLLAHGAFTDYMAVGSTAMKLASNGGHKDIVEMIFDSKHEGKKNRKRYRVKTDDVDLIRDCLRERAREWWASSDSSHLGNVAACDWYCDEGMGRAIKRGDGYLFGKKLICDTCCNKILQEMSGKPIEVLDEAWESELYCIALKERREGNR